MDTKVNKINTKMFYGWYIVMIAFLGNFMGTGTSFYIFNAFIEPLCEQRGWTRMDINIAPMFGWCVTMVATFAYGTIVTRVGPRILMALGALISAVSFVLLGMANELWIFYILFMMLFLGNGGMSGVVANTAVNNWFVLRRGNALGIATAGISLSGVILPTVALMILESSNLEHAFLYIGIAIAVVSPLAWLVIRNKPEEHGLNPDGNISSKTNHESRAPTSKDSLIEIKNIYQKNTTTDDQQWTFKQLFNEPAFWKIGLSYGLVMMGVVGVMFQLKPRFSDIGFDKKTAMMLMSLTALVGTIGKYIWAAMCDRFSTKWIVVMLMAANSLGLCFALITHSIFAVIAFIIIFGFAMGGVVSTLPVIIADYFGRNSYASVARFIGILMGINVTGYLVMGKSYDMTGSYNAAYITFIFIDLIAVFLVLTIKKPEEKSSLL